MRPPDHLKPKILQGVRGMDIRKVKKLIELLEESGISELEISEGEESVRISRHPRMAMQAPIAMASPLLQAAPTRGASTAPYILPPTQIRTACRSGTRPSAPVRQSRPCLTWIRLPSSAAAR